MRPDSRSASDWLERAASDLAVARRGAGPEALFETLCFLAQQAAEKALKAVLISRGIEPPWTHQLGRLLALLPPDVARPCEAAAVVSLTEYAAETRYPTPHRAAVTEAEYREALRLAEVVVEWATQAVAGAKGP